MLLPIAIALVFIIGYLAQSIGLCMVRGVSEYRSGKPEFLLAVLFSGVLAWVAILYADFTNTPTQFRAYKADIWFALGGFLFGLGAAVNQGCGVSTLSRLSRGDFKMLFSVAGWVVGWLLLAKLEYNPHRIEFIVEPNSALASLVALSIFILYWALTSSHQQKKLWLTMMLIGLISGFVFLFDPKWPPSGLLHKVSEAIAKGDSTLWPSIESHVLFISLIIGMFAAAWHTKNFQYIASNWRQWLLHIFAGTLMGVGASLALGGNDSQLLLSLPTFSPAGLVSVLSMVFGIWLAMMIKSKRGF
jgi:drug/metabolite transporter (DMT)-like permease